MNHRRKLLKLLLQVTMYCVVSNQFWEVSVLRLAPICVRLPEGGHRVTAYRSPQTLQVCLELTAIQVNVREKSDREYSYIHMALYSHIAVYYAINSASAAQKLNSTVTGWR